MGVLSALNCEKKGDTIDLFFWRAPKRLFDESDELVSLGAVSCQGQGDGSFRRTPDIVVGGGPVALVGGHFGGLLDGILDLLEPNVGHDLAIANHAGYVSILSIRASALQRD